MKIALACAYAGLVILANWLASRWIVGVGFGLAAPAGVFAIGGVLVIRDWLAQLAGAWYALAVMLVTGVVSYVVTDLAGWTPVARIALASLVAFLVSETLEAVVFSPLRRRSLTGGVAVSATVGTVIDSLAFLWIAFGSLEFLDGQIVGKTYMVALGVVLTAGRRWALPAAPRAA